MIKNKRQKTKSFKGKTQFESIGKTSELNVLIYAQFSEPLYIPQHSYQCLPGKVLEVIMDLAWPPVSVPFPCYQKSFKHGAKVKTVKEHGFCIH